MKPAAGSRNYADFLTFVLGSDHFALPRSRVREVLDRKRLQPSPAFDALPLLGSIATRSGPVPVVDLRRRLEIEPLKGEDECLIVAETTSQQVPALAFLASQVSYSGEVSHAGVEALPALATPRAAVLCGILRLQDRILLVVDPDRLFEEREATLVRCALAERAR